MIEIKMPDWSKQTFVQPGIHYDTDERKAEIAIGMSYKNVTHNTGGPFGAAIFDDLGMLIAVGVNVVVPENACIAHAEMMAIMEAQKRLRTHDFSLKGHYTLATSAEPCAMCAGAIMWSGLSKVIYSATSEDVEKIGFDEGDKQDFIQAMNKRGIEVVAGLLRENATAILQMYAYGNEIIYNAKNNKRANEL